MNRKKLNKSKRESPLPPLLVSEPAAADTARVAKICGILTGLLAFLLYLPAVQNGFVDSWDDNRYVVMNPHIQSLSLQFFRWAFLDASYHLWHPVTWISHAFDYFLWGREPLGHHLVNIMLHAVNTSVVVAVSFRLLEAAGDLGRADQGSDPEHKPALIAAGIAGLLFAVHPMHVESVAWIAERKDLLYSLFYLWSLLHYIRYVRDRAQGASPRPFYIHPQYLWAFFFFVLSASSKPMAVTLPAVLLVLDWYPFRRVSGLRRIVPLACEKIPFFAVSVGVSILTIVSQRAVGGIRTLEEASVAARVGVACKGLLVYLAKLLVPVHLLPFYPYPKQVSLLDPVYLGSIILVFAITAGCLWGARRAPAWLAGWLYFVLSLFPVLGFLQAGAQFIADRFVYLPSLGPFVFAGLAVAWVLQKVADPTGPRGKKIIAAVVAVVGLFYGILTFNQIDIWHDSITLWSYHISQEPRRYPQIYFYRGEEYAAKGNLDKAAEDFVTTIALDPKHDDAYIDLGVIHMSGGEIDEAIKDFSSAIKIHASADAFSNRANAYYKKGDIKRALAEYALSIAADPKFSEAYVNRGIVYRDTGEIAKAIADFSTAVSLKPELVKVYLARGDLYLKTGAMDKAMKDYQKACALGDSTGCQKAFFPFGDALKTHPGT